MTKLEILLLVENNQPDIEIATRIIRTVSSNISIVVQDISEAALIYLRQVVSPPQLILLDIGLPKMEGIEFIKQMRQIKFLQSVPIVILTGVALDIARAHAADVAAGYIVKPIEVTQFKEILDKLGFTT